MPELPEIESIKRVIEPQIQGLGIEQIHVSRQEVVAHPAADEFCSRLRGQVFDSVTRRGKFLVIHLESGDKIIIHLRMTGCLLVTPADYPEENHQRMSAGAKCDCRNREYLFGRNFICGRNLSCAAGKQLNRGGLGTPG